VGRQQCGKERKKGGKFKPRMPYLGGIEPMSSGTRTMFSNTLAAMPLAVIVFPLTLKPFPEEWPLLGRPLFGGTCAGLASSELVA
jgi:hypothetical protein